ncbi:MAG: vWA domain-containing protein [Chthonomonadales bacterium]
MTRIFLTALTAAIVCGSANAQKGQIIHTQSHNNKTLEMVFVIDTTGSMGGLIDGAKQKVWSIVNGVMKSNDHPAVKVGLVAYRDHGDEYVTRVLALTSDLDKVYSTLMAYRADGGGDEPEDVRQALADGVNKGGWSKRSPEISQIMFLVGDAPPHDDYGQEPSCQVTTATAVDKGLVVNAIQCGSSDSTRKVWQDLARRGEGEYFAIAQDGGVQSISTPYDKELSELGGKIGSTYMPYGGGAGGGHARSEMAKRQSGLESSFASAGGKGALADRAYNKAINSAGYNNDLLQTIEDGKKLKDIKKEDLPDNIQKMPTPEREQFVNDKLAQRKQVRSRILELSKKRDSYIADKLKTMPAEQKNGFDGAVNRAIKKEMSRK